MATHAAVREELGSTSLTTEKTDPAETKVGQLQVAVLVNEQIIGLEITAKLSAMLHIVR